MVAAGAPWFMTVFGRDSLLTAWMALLVDPDLALGVLQTLARFQGTEVDPRHEEEPGRILHEMRFGDASSLSLGGGSIYYGTADATPLFVMLLGELRRWGLARELVDELLPNADRAIEWIEHFGDADGDGYVEYQRATDRGLANQGWKDSWDGIRYADGRVAEAPIALAEVQAYTYGAYLARAHFAFEAGDTATYDRFRAKAAHLKAAFNRDFWLEDRGWFAVGLDADKRPIDSLTSNIGHCLWTGIVDEDKAHRVAQAPARPRRCSPAGGSGRSSATMAATTRSATTAGRCGPTTRPSSPPAWPATGSTGPPSGSSSACSTRPRPRAAGCPSSSAASTAASCPCPSGYPTSCSPQAWAAASPLLCLRTLLRLDPWVPYGKTWLCPDPARGDRLPPGRGDPPGRGPGRPSRWAGGARRGDGQRAAPRDRADPRAPPALDRRLNTVRPPGAARGRRAGHQPRSTHSSRWGDSAPMVVPAPWPGRTRVSPSNGRRAGPRSSG